MDKRKEILITALQENDEDIRKRAADALEKLEVRSRLEAVEKKLSAGEMLEKIRAVYALTDLKGPKIAELLAMASKDSSEDVRAAAVRVLGNFGDASALAPLVELLKDPNPIVVRATVEALLNFRDSRLLGPLMHTLKHQDTGVVERAIEAVGRFGDKRSEEAMIYFASKGNPKMKGLAIKALGEMDR